MAMRKLTRVQIRRLVMQEAKVGLSSRSFADVSGYAHEAGLYEAIGDLYNKLMDAGIEDDEAERWLRELVQDDVDSHMQDVAGGNPWDD